jgi:hypothetical protein
MTTRTTLSVAAIARGPHPTSHLCAAGFQPPHILPPMRLSTACADSPAQSPPYGVPRHSPLVTRHCLSNRHLETIRNGRNPFEFNQMTFSNRPKITQPIFAAPSESAPVFPPFNLPLLTPNLQKAKKRLMETHPSSKFGLNNCNHSCLRISDRNKTTLSTLRRARFQPPASSIQPPESNRSWYRLEFNISPTKQTTEALSNRS